MKIILPSQLAKLADNQTEINLGWTCKETISVYNALQALVGLYPTIKDRVFDGKGYINKFLNVYINDEDIRFLNGPVTELKDEDMLSIVPAIAGG